jgi:proteasome maturation protein
MDSFSLPHYDGPVDHMRNGLRSLESEMSAPHPIAALQRSNMSDRSAKLDTVRRLYGSHMAMRLETERQIFSKNHRLPGLESSKIARQTLMGSDETMEFSDFLNGCFLLFLKYLCTSRVLIFPCSSMILDPSIRPEAHRLEVHSQMEIKLGLF